jgi:hypothetical protein
VLTRGLGESERWDPATRREEGEWVFSWLDNSQALRFPFSTRIYNDVELGEMAKRSGFCRTWAYGSLGADPLTPESDRLVFVAEK